MIHMTHTRKTWPDSEWVVKDLGKEEPSATVRCFLTTYRASWNWLAQCGSVKHTSGLIYEETCSVLKILTEYHKRYHNIHRTLQEEDCNCCGHCVCYQKGSIVHCKVLEVTTLAADMDNLYRRLILWNSRRTDLQ